MLYFEKELVFFNKYSCYCKTMPKIYYSDEGNVIRIIFTPNLNTRVKYSMNKWGFRKFTIQGSSSNIDCFNENIVNGGKDLLKYLKILRSKHHNFEFTVNLLDVITINSSSNYYIESVNIFIRKG